jgi:hypothetical protein
MATVLLAMPAMSSTMEFVNLTLLVSNYHLMLVVLIGIGPTKFVTNVPLTGSSMVMEFAHLLTLYAKLTILLQETVFLVGKDMS